MPRLDSHIPLESHKPDCPNPTAKRLYIRNYDQRGNQKVVPWGLVCENCGVIIKQAYKHNPTKKQIDKRMSMPKLPFTILDEETNTATTTNQKLSKEEFESRHLRRLKELKIRRSKEKESANAQNSRLFKATRNRIKALNKIYKDDCICYPLLKKMINWDPKLVERFLANNPTYTEMVEVLDYGDLYRNTIRRANKYRGWITDPDNSSQLIIDPSHKVYRPHPKKPHTWKLNMDPNKIGEFEKQVINENEGRMELMQYIIRKHLESKVEVHYIVQDEKKTDLKDMVKS